jgi:hypothetical protein
MIVPMDTMSMIWNNDEWFGLFFTYTPALLLATSKFGRNAITLLLRFIGSSIIVWRQYHISRLI